MTSSWFLIPQLYVQVFTFESTRNVTWVSNKQQRHNMQLCTITITIDEHKLPKLGEMDKGSDKEGKIRDLMQG